MLASLPIPDPDSPDGVKHERDVVLVSYIKHDMPFQVYEGEDGDAVFYYQAFLFAAAQAYQSQKKVGKFENRF